MESKRQSIGYIAGVFDLFHIGHLNVLRNAKAMCDKLIVGVTTDELVSYKHKKAVTPFTERCEIVRAVKYVDVVVPQESMDKLEAWKKLKFDFVFVGDDWYNTPKWREIEEKFKEVGVQVIYFPYTKGISSTILNSILDRERSLLLNSEEDHKIEECKTLLEEERVKIAKKTQSA